MDYVVSNPLEFILLLISGIIAPIFGAYHFNTRETSLELGRRLSKTADPRKLQDALRLKSQTRNTLVMYGIWGLFMSLCIIAFHWRIAIAVIFFVLYMGTNLVSKIIIPPVMSHKWIDKIRKSLDDQLREYQNSKDNAGSVGIGEIISLLDEYQQKKNDSQFH